MNESPSSLNSGIRAHHISNALITKVPINSTILLLRKYLVRTPVMKKTSQKLIFNVKLVIISTFHYDEPSHFFNRVALCQPTKTKVLQQPTQLDPV